MSKGRIADLRRYPVKGMTGERLEQVRLIEGEGLPLDRAFAIAHGRSAFDPAAPRWLQKTHFLMLMRNERLAALDAAYDEISDTLTLRKDGVAIASGALGSAAGRAALERYLDEFCGDEAQGGLRLVSAPGHMFSDVPAKVVSVINLASVGDLERYLGRPVHPLRFRANLYLDGLEPWQEFDWVGRELQAGNARLKVLDRIERCAATDVNPETAARDMRIPKSLNSYYGHQDMGVYAEVVSGGLIAVGDFVARL